MTMNKTLKYTILWERNDLSETKKIGEADTTTNAYLIIIDYLKTKLHLRSIYFQTYDEKDRTIIDYGSYNANLVIVSNDYQGDVAA